MPIRQRAPQTGARSRRGPDPGDLLLTPVLAILGVQLGEGLERASEAQLDDGAQTRALDVRDRQLRVARVGLERDHLPAGRKRARQPDRAVSAQRSQLENGARADRASEQIQKLSLRRRDGDCGQAGST